MMLHARSCTHRSICGAGLLGARLERLIHGFKAPSDVGIPALSTQRNQ
jgi:hypothetical protein